MNTINPLHTSCKNCIFAIYNDITQTGCSLNELEKLKTYNVEILEAYDEEKEFYVVNKNKCFKHRELKWKHSFLLLDEQQKFVNEEIAINYHAMIFANNNLDDIQKTLSSIETQELPPKYITIIRYANSQLTPTSLYQLFHKSSIPWRVENIIKPLISDNEIIDLIVPFINSRIYATFYAGFKVPPTTFSQLNHLIHNEFFHFVILLPNSTKNGLIVSNYVHKIYQGNKDLSLKEKLEAEECPYLIPITDIIKDFPK